MGTSDCEPVSNRLSGDRSGCEQMELFRATNFDFLGKKWPFIIASLVLTAAGLVSLAVNGGPRYGIDFKGGTMTTVKFQGHAAGESDSRRDRSEAWARARPCRTSSVARTKSPSARKAPAAIRGQRVLQTLEIDLWQSFRRQAGLEQRERHRYRQPAADAASECERRRLSDDQLNKLALRHPAVSRFPAALGSALQLRPAFRGTRRDAAGVERAEAGNSYLSPFALRSSDVVGPKIGADLRRQAIVATLCALGGMLIYIAFRFEWIYGWAR